MAIIKCKMCGGDLDISEGMTVAQCEYCGTRQTVPSADSEKKTGLFLRAEKLRRDCDFDRAAAIYDSIIAEFPAEPEAYWGLVLCKYGIEYVDDPATGKKVPTCHRSSYDSVMEDENLEKVMDCADAVARKVYREEAKVIEELRKGILEVSGKEPPYDIFICYKETNENGERTVDSVLAQDVYDALTEKGYRVFFSRITLEDKLGTEYEPYIFAALNSAKIMLVFGTDYEYFNAVWVKNEWSRYLKLMAGDKSRHLIPCYKDVDAYDMPKEFQKLQAQDLGKVGALQDLLRGIDKLLGKGTKAAPARPAAGAGAGGPTAASLLERAQMFLEELEWDQAEQYFDKVLDIDPKCAQAYVGKLCFETKCARLSDLAECDLPFYEHLSFEKALRFADPALRAQLEGYRERGMKLQAEIARKQEKIARQLEETRIREQAELEKKKERLAPIIHAAQGLLLACGTTDVGLHTDGTVVATGFHAKEVSSWRDIVAVTAGGNVGLKVDGTVVCTGLWRVSDLRDVVAVSGIDSVFVYLKADGTAGVYRDDFSYNSYEANAVSRWKDIVAVSAGQDHTVGLKADGTVVAVGKNAKGQCNVQYWRDIVAVSAGDYRTVGLKADGTVVCTCSDIWNNFSGWQDIVAISAGYSHTVGLKADGTVVAVGDNRDGQCNVSDWRDIVTVSAGARHTVGLKLDGTVVAVGDEKFVRTEIEEWKLFENPDTLVRERREAKERGPQERARRRAEDEAQRAQRAQRRAELEQEQTNVKEELYNWKSLFAVKHRKELEARLAEIEAELKKL